MPEELQPVDLNPNPELQLPSSTVLAQATPAKAYPVDYVVGLRNALAIALIILVVMHVMGAGNSAGKKRKGDAPKKGYGILIALATVGLLAMQAWSTWMYMQESGDPGTMHKTVPFGREYYFY